MVWRGTPGSGRRARPLSCAPEGPATPSSISRGVNSTRSIPQQARWSTMKLLVAGHPAPPLEPARRVHDEVGAGQETWAAASSATRRRPCASQVWLEFSPAAGTEGQPVVPGQLAGAQQADAPTRGCRSWASRTACRCWTGTSRRSPGSRAGSAGPSAMPDSALGELLGPARRGIVTGDTSPP